jgi:glycosyltransferase involved in cell wall biosynthesis
MIRISAIIPTYNRAGLVSRAVDSVLAQTYPAAELLVIDDGSTDETRAVLSEYGSQIRYIFQENAGLAGAVDTGVQNASSEWVAFLGSDDVWTPDFLERLVAAVEATDGAAPIYFTDLKMQGATETMWDIAGFSIEGEYEFQDDASDWYMLDLQPMSSQATLYRRDDVLATGALNEGMRCREDTYLFFLMGLKEAACAVRGVGAIVTADAEDTRQTTIYHHDSRSYCEHTIVLYRNVLRRCAPLPPRHRRALRRQLAHGYFRRARLDWSDRDIFRTAGSVVRSGAIAPSVPLSRIGRWTFRIGHSAPPDYVYRHPQKH